MTETAEQVFPSISYGLELGKLRPFELEVDTEKLHGVLEHLGASDEQIESLYLHFYGNSMDAKCGFYGSPVEDKPPMIGLNLSRISISKNSRADVVMPDDAVLSLNHALLHELKHFADDQVEGKRVVYRQVEAWVPVVLGGLVVGRALNSPFNDDPFIVDAVETTISYCASRWLSGRLTDAVYEHSRIEHRARKFADEVILDPAFNSIINLRRVEDPNDMDSVDSSRYSMSVLRSPHMSALALTKLAYDKAVDGLSDRIPVLMEFLDSETGSQEQQGKS